MYMAKIQSKKRGREEQIPKAEKKRPKRTTSLGRPDKEKSPVKIFKAEKKPKKKCSRGELHKAVENSMQGEDDKVQEELDPELLKTIPDSLIKEIVLRIPQQQLPNFRAVCKEWNSFIINQEWLEIDNPVQLESRLPALLFWGPREVVNRDESDWIQTCYFSKSRNSGWKPKTLNRPTCIPALSVGEELQLMTSEGGLLFFGCCRRKTTHFTDLLVCNPLLGESKRLHLPSPAANVSTHFCAELCFFGVVVIPETSSYKIVVAGVDPVLEIWDDSARFCFLYESITSSWKKCCAPPPLRLHCDFVGGRCVFCNGSFYWLARPRKYIAIQPMFIVRYDMRNDIWVHIETDFHKNNKTPDIILHQGQVSFSNMGEETFHYRRLGFGLELDVPYLEYESLARVIPSQVRRCENNEDENDEDLFRPMSLCFSYGEFCIQVGPDLKTDSMKDLWTCRECPRFKITMQSTFEDTRAELNWATEGTQFLERDPDRVFGFSPSLTMLP